MIAPGIHPLKPWPGLETDHTALRRPPRRYMATKLTPWYKYDLDFCMWLQANFDRLVEEFSCESR